MNRLDDTREGAALAGLLEANRRRAIRGARGQAALAELARTLRIMPRKRLSARALCDGPDVCALGALALHRAYLTHGDWDRALGELPVWLDGQEELIAYAERELGLTVTLAWSLLEINDGWYGRLSPEERHAAVLTWVRANLGRAVAA